MGLFFFFLFTFIFMKQSAYTPMQKYPLLFFFPEKILLSDDHTL